MKKKSLLPWLHSSRPCCLAILRPSWFLVLLLLGALVPAGRAQTAAPPEFMTYQGFLTDANGIPLGANNPLNYTITFKVYGSPTGDDALWGETQIVTVDKGNFNVLLGRGTRLSLPNVPATVKLPDVFASSTASDRYIGISVSGNNISAEIKPRLRLLPSPYAYLATSALRLTDALGNPLLDNQAGRVVGNGSGLTNLAAANISGILSVGAIPNLDASKISGGTLDLARIPTLDATRIPPLDAGKITAGTLNLARIPVLDSSKIPVLDSSKIGGVDASKIVSGVINSARLPAVDAGQVTQQTIAAGVTTNLVKVVGKPPVFVGSANRVDLTTWHGKELDLTPFLDDDDGCRVWFHLAHETDNDKVVSTTLNFAGERLLDAKNPQNRTGISLFIHGPWFNEEVYGSAQVYIGDNAVKFILKLSSGWAWISNYKPKEINNGVDGPVNTGANAYKLWFMMPPTVNGYCFIYDH